MEFMEFNELIEIKEGIGNELQQSKGKDAKILAAKWKARALDMTTERSGAAAHNFAKRSRGRDKDPMWKCLPSTGDDAAKSILGVF